jgi:hypothetical protein
MSKFKAGDKVLLIGRSGKKTEAIFKQYVKEHFLEQTKKYKGKIFARVFVEMLGRPVLTTEDKLELLEKSDSENWKNIWEDSSE